MRTKFSNTNTNFYLRFSENNSNLHENLKYNLKSYLRFSENNSNLHENLKYERKFYWRFSENNLNQFEFPEGEALIHEILLR